MSVKDQGKGLSPDDQEIILKKFRQVTSENSPLVKGTGLGLTIAKALVEQHGGVIYVTSKPNDGATFYFTLKDWRYSESAKSKECSMTAAEDIKNMILDLQRTTLPQLKSA